MNDPIIVLGWIWAIYLTGRLVGEAVDAVFLPRLLAADATGAMDVAAADTSALTEAPANATPRRRRTSRSWTPIPAVAWLLGEAGLAAVVVGVAWFYLRNVNLDLVPATLSASPADIRRVAVAAILGWSLLVINVPVAMRLVGRLLPDEPTSRKGCGDVDPERMGATIGVLERLLIVALMPSGGSAAVGFVVAAKTLARFKELDKKRFAERYLLGTMASVIVAMLSSIAAQWLWMNQI
jgi:hypothetical protein